MKISIIGGGGLVGSMAAYAMQCGAVGSHLCIIDANKDVAQGVALDLLQGACLVADQRITAGTMEDIPTSNVVVITAGLRRKPDESRLDLINRNVDLFLNLLDQAKSAGLKENAYLVVVSNPVDVLTYLACQRSGLDPSAFSALELCWIRLAFAVIWQRGFRFHPPRCRRFCLANTATAWFPSGPVPPLAVCHWINGPAATPRF